MDKRGDLPVKWRSSRSNNSATRATIHKRIGVCESPRDKLCHKQNIMSKFEVSEFCRAFEFLDWGDDWVTHPGFFSATATIIDINSTAYESL